jgi:methyl-accepting chemotaxis protein
VDGQNSDQAQAGGDDGRGDDGVLRPVRGHQRRVRISVTGRGGIRVDRRIVVDGKTVGYLSIRAENAAIVGRLATEAVIAITAFVLGVLVALFLFEKLNHTIMAPLVELHETLRRVVRSRNYSIRATRKADDELSDVVMAVNDLLAQVEATTASSSLSSTPPTTPVRADAPVVSK